MRRSGEINRRAFLVKSLALGATAALAPAATVWAAGIKVPAIDTHTHFYDPTRPQGVPWPGKDNDLLYRPHLPEQFQKIAAPHGVVGTVVVEASPWVEDNQWVLDLAEQNPFIVGFIGNLKAGKPDFADNLRRFSQNPLFRGLRLGGNDLEKNGNDPAFQKDLRLLADQNLTLDLLGQGKMLPEVIRLARLLPNLRIVLDHLPFPEWDQDLAGARRALEEVANHQRIYVKVSDVVRQQEGKLVKDPAFYRPRLDLLWELFGPDRVIFASNWPVSNRIAPYGEVYGTVAGYVAKKGRAAEEKFFWKNSLAAYSWVARGKANDLVKPGR
jgi:L-fuconolactonase